METRKIITLLLCSVIIAVGIIIGSAVSSSTLADRPLTGSFSGSLSSSDYHSDIMTTDGLMVYLGIFPTNENMDYGAERKYLMDELKTNILDGKWIDFPYVNLNGTLYFSKAAVDEWFAEKGKTQLTVD